MQKLIRKLPKRFANCGLGMAVWNSDTYNIYIYARLKCPNLKKWEKQKKQKNPTTTKKHYKEKISSINPMSTIPTDTCCFTPPQKFFAYTMCRVHPTLIPHFNLV